MATIAESRGVKLDEEQALLLRSVIARRNEIDKAITRLASWFATEADMTPPVRFQDSPDGTWMIEVRDTDSSGHAAGQS